MKKVFKTSRYRRYNRHKSYSEIKKKKRFKNYLKNKNVQVLKVPKPIQIQRNRVKKYINYKNILAPRHLSLIENPEKTITFLNKIRECFHKKMKVFVDLNSVENISYDAIVVLLSIMIQFRSHKIDFNGNFPKTKSAHKILINSGFLNRLYDKVKEEDQYKLIATDNSIITHAQKGVDSELAEKLIESASNNIWGTKRRCTGVQRIFLELMQNTNNHAVIGKIGEKHWWISMNHNVIAKKVSFSFIDYGVGIFNSLENKTPGNKFYGWKKLFIKTFSASKNDEFIELILKGELHKTVTGKYYRGKGLPGIYNSLAKNQISRLYILTNDTFADVSKNIYRTMSTNLEGTFVYWELDYNNESKPWNQL